MKFGYILILALVLITNFCCLDEVGPSITIEKTDRVVLIEEFTGVRCVNCPQGSAEINALVNTYGKNLIAISIHGGIFSDPYSDSNYDFRTDDGDDLIGYLNAPSTGPAGYPAAVVNRKLHNGVGQDRAVFQSSWSGIIGNEVQQKADVQIEMNKFYDASTRTLKISPALFFQEDVPGEVHFTALITQDSIIDVQLDQSGKVPNYAHRHVLRDVITSSYSGDVVGTDILKNAVENLNYTYVIPNDWDVSKCYIVVFVNKNDGSTLDVLQAAEAHVE
jgi:hypothetical protein